MVASSDEGSPAGEGAEIIWLFDPDAGPRPEPAAWIGQELYARLARAAFDAGLVAVSVRGVVCGIRRRGRMCTFDVVDRPPGADGPVAVVHVVLFPDELRAVEAHLAEAQLRLVDGLHVIVSGELRFDPPRSGVRLLAEVVEVDTEAADAAADRARRGR